MNGRDERDPAVAARDGGGLGTAPELRELQEMLARYRLDLAAERARGRRLLAEAFRREEELRKALEAARRREGELEGEVRRLEDLVEQTRLALESETGRLKEALVAAREEVEAWKRSHEAAQEGIRHLQGELARWSGSKLGRLASRYWRVRERLAGMVRRRLPSGGEGPSAGGESVAGAAREGAGSRRPGPRRSTIAVPPGFPARPRGAYDVVVFSIIDWDFRFQRPQQLALQFGRHGHRVFYLSTSKVLEKKRVPAELVSKAPGVAEVVLGASRRLDIYGGRLTGEDVETLLESLVALAGELAMGDVVAMVQIPFWEPLAVRLREVLGWHVVYDCMDEWSNFPGFGDEVLKLEPRLAAESDLTVVSGETLVAKFEDLAPRVLLAKNAVDLTHYETYYGPNGLLEGMSRPIVGYFGALASWVDVPLLEKMSERFPQVQFVLAGGVFDVDLSNLEVRPNVHLLGQRPYEEMPRLLWHFDVCMIPFQINEITHATNPVKLYEYCYSGKPIVAPRLRELEPFADVCYLSETHEEFLGHLEAALAEPMDDPRREQRREVAASNDWSERYGAIHAALRDGFPLVSVVIVTYGGLEHTRRCLESLEAETWPRMEIIVVDNASPDGTPQFLEDYARDRAHVQVLLNSENRGFAAANNQGLERARGEVLVLLNNDTVVPPGLLGRLVRKLRSDPSIGLLCPTTNFCGNEALVEADYEGLADLPAAASRRAAAFAGQELELSVAAMYCVALRREVFERVGLLDEEFGIGMFEDDDYSLRVREAGFRVVCAEDAYVHHVGQASFATLSREAYEALWKKNQAYFEKKWGRPWQPHTTRSGVEPVSSKVGGRQGR